MGRFEVCHVLAHKRNPGIKGSQAWGCRTVYFASQRRRKKNGLSSPTHRIEGGEGSERRWVKGPREARGRPRPGQPRVSGSAADCEEASTHEMHLDSVR